MCGVGCKIISITESESRQSIFSIRRVICFLGMPIILLEKERHSLLKLMFVFMDLIILEMEQEVRDGDLVGMKMAGACIPMEKLLQMMFREG